MKVIYSIRYKSQANVVWASLSEFHVSMVYDKTWSTNCACTFHGATCVQVDCTTAVWLGSEVHDRPGCWRVKKGSDALISSQAAGWVLLLCCSFRAVCVVLNRCVFVTYPS